MGSLLDLYATLNLDTSEYEEGIKDAVKKSESFGEMASHAIGNLISDGLEKAASAAFQFGKESIKTGMDFEASMSQVAATMGKPLDEISDLTEVAKSLGATTQFSAVEASQGLNFLALAGMDAEQQVATLPHVLDLAAAGGMGLAESADLVTDAMSALGMEFDDKGENVTDFGDKLSKTASTTNTSVSQLGEAILTVGATGKSMTGTFRKLANGEKKVVSGTSHLNAALGILANVGIKGSEGGTHLRNVLLSLQSPTDDAADALNSLGVSIYNSDGTMRNLNDIMVDLNDSMGDMDQQAKDNVLSKIFNKTDLASAQALMSSAGDTWEDLADTIEDSEGAMGKMAKTMNDNLAGALNTMDSAVDGFKIAVYEKIAPPLTGLVEFGTGAVSAFTEELNKPKTLLDTFIEDIGKSNDEVRDLVKEASKTIDVSDNDVSKLEAYRDLILEINNKDDPDAFDRYTMKTVVEELKTNMPELYEAYDTATEHINLTDTAINALFRDQEKLIQQNATKKAREQALEAISEGQVNALMAEAAEKNAQSDLDAYAADHPFAGGGNDPQYRLLYQAKAKAQAEKEEALKYVEEATAIYENLFETYGDTDETMNPATRRAEEAEQALQESMNAQTQTVSDGMDAQAQTVSDGMNTQTQTVSDGMEAIDSSTEAGMSQAVSTVNANTSNIETAWNMAMNNMETETATTMSHIAESLGAGITFNVNAQVNTIGSVGDAPVVKHAKAMSQPYILNDATIFGSMNGSLLEAGEAGSEMVVGTSTMMGMIRKASGSEEAAAVFSSGIEQIVGILSEYLPQKQRVYLDSGALVGQIAPEIDTTLGRIAMRRKVL